jgi:hypothetical protein
MIWFAMTSLILFGLPPIDLIKSKQLSGTARSVTKMFCQTLTNSENFKCQSGIQHDSAFSQGESSLETCEEQQCHAQGSYKMQEHTWPNLKLELLKHLLARRIEVISTAKLLEPMHSHQLSENNLHIP